MDSNYIQLIDSVRYGLRRHAPLFRVTSDLIILAQRHQVDHTQKSRQEIKEKIRHD